MHLWSEARVTLRLSDEEFYALTPRQFAILRKFHGYEVRHRELLNGLVCSTTANYSMGAPEKPLKAADFMPSQWSVEASAAQAD